MFVNGELVGAPAEISSRLLPMDIIQTGKPWFDVYKTLILTSKPAIISLLIGDERAVGASEVPPQNNHPKNHLVFAMVRYQSWLTSSSLAIAIYNN